MGLLKGIEENPDFVDDTFLSAALLNELQRNIEIADAASRYGRVAFCSWYGEPVENNSTNPVKVFTGGFAYVTGATTLTIVTASTGIQSGDQLRVIRGGTPENGFADGAINDFTLANGEQTHTVTISGAGYVEDRVVEVRMFLRNASAGDEYDWGNVEIRDAYIGPIDLAGWVAPSTITTISESALDALSNACTYVIRRIGQRVEPLFQAIIRRQGPFTGQTTARWRGSIVKSAEHPTIKALVAIQQKAAGTTETLRMRVNGAVVASQALPTSPREAGYILTYDASAVPNGTRLWIEVDVVKTAPAEEGVLSAPDTSRWSLYRVWSEAAVGSISLSQPLAARSNKTFGPAGAPTTLLHWLNELVTAVNAIKARIDANPEVYGRQTLYTARYAHDDDQWKWFELWEIASSMQRVGMALLLRGKGIEVCWGPGTFKEEFNEIGAQVVENFRKETAIDADAVETQRVFLDNLPGLPPTAPFNVRGIDLFYAGEEFLVEEA